jgi:hypothetical protein
VAAVRGYALTWVRPVAHRSNAAGEAGSGDRRHAKRGGRRLLSPEQEAALDPAREGAAPGGGRGTAAQVAAWMRQQLGRPGAEGTGGRYLRRRDWRRSRPRAPHAKADQADQAAQAALAPTDWARRWRRRPSPPRPSRSGPATSSDSGASRSGVRSGRGVASGRSCGCSRACSGSSCAPLSLPCPSPVPPASARSEWQFASPRNTAVRPVALEAFARAVGAGPAKRVGLVLEQAGGSCQSTAADPGGDSARLPAPVLPRPPPSSLLSLTLFWA